MRILLLHHAPFQQSPPGMLAWHWAQALEAAGNDVRLLIADEELQVGEPLHVDRVVCGSDPNADLLFRLPRFSIEDIASGRPTFKELSDAQLARYRDCFRRRLDNQILHFDPHVIHVQHIWLLGQLALESGVPYVLNGWDAELADYPQDARYWPLADQAAENASRILVGDETLKQKVAERFESAAERIVVVPTGISQEQPPHLNDAGKQLQGIYETLLGERFG